MTSATIGPDGLLIHAGRRFRAALGKGGIALHKTEGDGATPAGPLPLRRILYRADRIARPRAAVPLIPLAPHDGWCDDPDDTAYNQLVRLPYPARHEALWRPDPIYDVIGMLGWNDAPVAKRRGSAIFLHVARPGYDPTEGCVALALPDLLDILATGLTGITVQT
jgi:L,D-peptidoglycan transpeptidase YkuD (ErfK/YbiS/YcfS/YnhG family)